MFDDPEFQRIHAEAVAAHEAKIDAALREIETSHPKLYELLAREIRNLRADSKVFMRQRDSAEKQQKRWETEAEEERKLARASKSAEREAKSESLKLRGLLYDLQKEVASWPRPGGPT